MSTSEPALITVTMYVMVLDEIAEAAAVAIAAYIPRRASDVPAEEKRS
jgi:hypothetical protein